MRFIYTILFQTLFSISVFASGNVNELLDSAEKAKSEYHHKEAAKLYFQILEIDSNHYETLWKASQICLHVGWLENDKDKGAVWYRKALKYARKALLIKPNAQESNMVMAIAVARNAQYVGPRGRVNACWEIKKYSDKAQKVSKDDPGIWQLMAWWNFELGRATWLEKSLASILFGGLPKGGTCDEAFECLRKAAELNPGYIGYLHDFALFYHRLGDDDVAEDYIERALDLSIQTPAEKLYRLKCEGLKKKL